MAYGAHMPIRRPQTLTKPTITAFVVAMAYGGALLLGREYVDRLLHQHGASPWSYVAVGIAMMVLWIVGGRLI